MVGESENNTQKAIQDVYDEIRSIKRDLYGNPNVRAQGVFERLERLEGKFRELVSTYERERVEKSSLLQLESRVDELALNYKLAIVYLKGIAAATTTVAVTMVGAIVVAVLRIFGAGGA